MADAVCARTLAELRTLELARCQAVSTCDLRELDRLLADDLTHTHVTGRTEGKSTYLANLTSRPRTTERATLDIRLYGDVAVLAGILRNRRPGPGLGIEGAVTTMVHALQVWTRSADGWQMVAFAASGVPT